MNNTGAIKSMNNTNSEKDRQLVRNMTITLCQQRLRSIQPPLYLPTDVAQTWTDIITHVIRELDALKINERNGD